MFVWRPCQYICVCAPLCRRRGECVCVTRTNNTVNVNVNVWVYIYMYFYACAQECVCMGVCACVCVCPPGALPPRLCQQYGFDRASQQKDRRYYWLFVCRISTPVALSLRLSVRRTVLTEPLSSPGRGQGHV